MGKRRNNLQINMDILETINQGKNRITSIFMTTNTTHSRAKRHLKYLIELGLINIDEENRHFIYSLTTKGKNTLIAYNNIKKFIPT